MRGKRDESAADSSTADSDGHTGLLNEPDKRPLSAPHAKCDNGERPVSQLLCELWLPDLAKPRLIR